MPSDVVDVMRRFKQQLRDKEARQMAQMTRAWRDVERSLESDLELLARELQEMAQRGEVVSQASLFRLNRFQRLIQQVQDQWQRYVRFAAQLITGGQMDFGGLGIDHAGVAISTSGVLGSFNVLPVTAVELMAGLLGDGSPLLAVLGARSVAAGMIQGMVRHLLVGTARGWNPRKTARKMRDALSGGLQKALTIARTEQMRVYREMNRQQMQASGVVSGYMRIATRDDRVCPACLALDGAEYPLDHVMEEHPQGRCGQIPIVIGQERPQWETGPAWLAKQPEGTQRAILGHKRFELWHDGKVSIEQMARIRQDGVWGASTQVAPVGALAGGQ